MRCTNCALPLSPTRTSCPRCGTPTASDPRAAAAQAQAALQQNYEQVWGRGAQQQSPYTDATWGSGGRDTPYNGPFPAPPQQQMPSGIRDALHYNSGPAWFPTNTPTANGGENGQFTAQDMNRDGSLSELPYYARGAPGTFHPRPQPSRKSNLGFIIAGLCVTAGAMILIFVYFMAMSVPGTSTTNTGSPGIVRATPSPVPTVASPTAVPSPTSVLPGQQYISNPQIGSAVDTKTARVTQPTTTFKVKQFIYVTFVVHPAGHSGAVCLLWYVNSQTFTNFAFAVTPTDTVAYSYTISRVAGPGYVELYWASTTACTDKTLAQRVSFTVTN